MKIYKIIILSVFLGSTFASCSQEQKKESTKKTIENKIKEITLKNYDILIFNVDSPKVSPTVPKERIKDPYATLTNCVIFVAEGVTDVNLDKPKGLIGIYNNRSDSIVWISNPLSEGISNLSGNISLVDEINSDGKTEIVFSQYLPPRGLIEQLWIFNWNGHEGNLISELDNNKESAILCDPYYDLIDVDSDGIYEIQGNWYEKGRTDEKTLLTYSWNGNIYGDWGKTSKYFQKGKNK